MADLASYNEIAVAFTQALALAHISIHPSEIDVNFSAAPHTPPTSLPNGKFAVYVFVFGERCLKVGKAGGKSAARFCSQHYGDNAPSTLAKSILKNQDKLNIHGVDKENVKKWIVDNTSRVNFLLDAKYGPVVLSFFEAFVQCRMRPEFEGFPSQNLHACNAAK